MFPEWTWVVGFWIGAAIGSFLGAVVYRMPRGLSLREPRNSFCPRCGKRLGWLDMIPLLSWIIQKGRCRHCGSKVSARYFAVELTTAIIWAGCWQVYLISSGDPIKAIAYAFFASGLVAAIFIDLEYYIIPDQVNAYLLLVGIALNGAQYFAGSKEAFAWNMPWSVAGGLTGVLALWGIAFFGRLLFGKDAMGHGDIKMARGIGAVLGPSLAMASFGMAVALGAVIGALQIVARLVANRRQASEAAESQLEEEEEEEYQPESISSLLICGIGYLLCIDVIGLFFPKLYEKWFGENPYAVETADDEEVEVGVTMIPFGPYLAAGAIICALFSGPILELIHEYVEWASGGKL